MLSQRSFVRSITSVVVLFALAETLTAHDFWIEPSSFRVAVGEPVRIHLRVGERFVGEPVVRDESRIERFFLAGPAAERPIIGRQGMDPAGLLRLESSGIWFAGYWSKPSRVQLPPDKFEAYLREEGLERIIDERARRKESQLPGRELFSRSVKSLLRAGDPANDTGCSKVLGLPLELVPDGDPVSSSGGRLPVRLLFAGRPLEGALVVAYRRDAGTRTEEEEAFRGRTDVEGRVAVPVAAGQWLIKAVHMQRAEPGSEADWHSVWTALTFEIPTPRDNR